MTLYPGFQKQVNLQVYQGYPGDLLSDRTPVTLAANGLFALGDVAVAAGCFYSTNGNQVATDSGDAGTTALAGFVLRNQGLAPMGWSDSQIGYGFIVPDGTQATVAVGGDIAMIILGVDTSGSATHVPTVGEYIWVNTTTGAIASAATSVATVTGYVRAGTFKITGVGYLTPATVGANQTFGKISGTL